MKPYNAKTLIYMILLSGGLISGIFILGSGYGKSDALISLGHSLTITAGLWLGCMTIVKWLWKKFPWEQKPVTHLLLEIVMILSYTILFSGFLYFIETRLDIFIVEHLFLEAFNTILITLLITSIHESAFFYRQWRNNFSKSVRLEKDNIEAKYETLKSQINPHFLFNSLNSLTTIVDDNKRAVDYINSLSEFLRYILSSRDKELILIRDEVKVLENYINLQKLRFNNTLHVYVKIPEKYFHYAIPPLVLQMLMENSIKHNIISKKKPLKVTIRAEKDTIIVENTLQKKTGVSSTGQGLRNISERYRFFTTNKVEISQTSSIFRVRIPLLLVEL